MFKLDSSTTYILFVFLLILIVIIYAYDDTDIRYSYQNKRIYDENINNQYYIYNQTMIDDVYPSYI